MPTLDYAPRIKWYRTHRFRRAAICLFILTILALTIYFCTTTVSYRRACMLYWQHQCLNHIDPPPATSIASSSGLLPEFVNFLDCLSPTPATARLSPRFYGVCRPRHVYLHARRTPANERLLAAWIEPDMMHVGGELRGWEPTTLRVTVIEPGTLVRDACILSSKTFLLNGLPGWGWLCTGCDPAYPDPSDPSAFVLPVHLQSLYPPSRPPITHLYTLRLTPDAAGVELLPPHSPLTLGHQTPMRRRP